MGIQCENRATGLKNPDPYSKFNEKVQGDQKELNIAMENGYNQQANHKWVPLMAITIMMEIIVDGHQ